MSSVPDPSLEPQIPVLRPTHTYASVTERISAIVFGRTPLGWYVALGVAMLFVGVLTYTILLPDLSGRWDLGDQHPGRMGIRDR